MKCPICFSKKTKLFHNELWRANNGKVYKCSNCDITFIRPAMKDDEEELFYKEYASHIKRRCKIKLQNAEQIHNASKSQARQRYTFIKSYLSDFDNVLEIGSSTGAFLEILKNSGKAKNLNAIEACSDSREYCKRFATKVYKSISELPKKIKFDAIFLFHVLEHIKKPINFLKLCKLHLKKRGTLLIEIPFIEDPLISFYNCRVFMDFYFQPMHPYVYSLKSLRHVFSKSGFKEKRVIYYQRYGLDNHLTWLLKGKTGIDGKFERMFGDDAVYKKTLQDIGKTDTIFYIAQ